MALTPEQIAIRNEAAAWLRYANQDRDGHSVAADLELQFPDTLGDEPAAPELDEPAPEPA